MAKEKIAILGGGESGAGSAVLARVKGLDVFLSDAGEIPQKYKSLLEEWEVPYEEGAHTEARILEADRVVKSPGIPDSAPLVAALRAKGTPVISEIEFAGAYTSARTICITGSNGKTTTTTLAYEMLRQGGLNVGLAGNIGESFALAVATRDYDYYVIELSSFQLDGMYDFRADIGILTNITPDHLDRYGNLFQRYIDSKLRIVQNQRLEDSFIYCADDPVIRENLAGRTLMMQTLPFGVKTSAGCAATLHGGIIHAEAGGRQIDFSAADLQIVGIHNTYNAMAATLAALSVGVSSASIARTLRSFAGVEHRLEPCGEVNGVLYINDSKATNVDSVYYALDGMTRPVVWIAGGTDKGNDYRRLYPLASEKVKALVCLGIENEKLIRNFADKVPAVVDTHSLAEAMQAAVSAAGPGDVVLLSPACASFDLFSNYEDRGRQFKAAIREMNSERKG